MNPESHTHRSPSDETPRLALLALCLAMLLSSLGTSSANVALPTLARSLAGSFQAAQWVVLAYLVAITASIVTVGRLADLLGRRQVLQAGLLLFVLGSAAAGFAPSFAWLLAARVVQGLGAAAMMALTVAFVGELLPAEQTGRAMGLLGTTSAIGTALGPSLGGALLTWWGWRAIFLINLPLGVVALVVARRSLPADTVRNATGAGLDMPGTLLLALGLAGYALAMTLGRGHFGALNLALLVGAGVAAAMFAAVQRRAASPLLPLGLLRDAPFAASLLANFLVSAVLMATLAVGPFHLALALGLEPSAVGLVMSVGPVVSAFVGVPAGRGVDRFGAERTSLVALGSAALGALLIAVVPRSFGVLGYVGPLAMLTASYATFQAANNTAVMRRAGPQERGLVSGVLTLSRNLGLVSGTAVLGAVFAWASGAIDPALAEPAAVARGTEFTFGVGAVLILVGLFTVRSARARGSRVVARVSVAPSAAQGGS
ncbi:MAG: MFS transporter [Polyangiales bacterium]|nr:MFS transporter [Myxococcales bacterium]